MWRGSIAGFRKITSLVVRVLYDTRGMLNEVSVHQTELGGPTIKLSTR